jgi:hypothetical protein
MHATLAFTKEWAAIVISPGNHPNDRQLGLAAGIDFTILVDYIACFAIEVPCKPKNIIRREKQVSPVSATFSAYFAAVCPAGEWKSIV